MSNPKFIKGFPLIKFKSDELIKSLQSGKIYLNSLKWFRDYENDSGDVVVGDSFEAMIHINEATFVHQESGEQIEMSDCLIPTTESNSYVFCMTYIAPRVESFQFDNQQKSEFTNFGDTALIILDSEEFINRIRAAANAKGYEIYFSAAHYYDESADLANVWFSLMQGTHNIAFWKRKAYSYQQEFRILIPGSGLTDDHLELDIGDISDISIIQSTDKVLEMKIEKVK